jgi:cardiolipin synthase
LNSRFKTMPNIFNQRPQYVVLLAVFVFGTIGCARLRDTEAILARHTAQAAQFETAQGPVSTQQSAAIVAALKRQSGDLDILDKQITLEQSINASSLVLGNKVTLLIDGPATHAAMLAAISSAKDHINMESYIIEDDAMGQEFAQALLKQ